MALQGVPFVTQWIGGRVLGTEALGSIRIVEVVFGIMLLVGGLGQATSALRFVASSDQQRARGGRLAGAALLAAGGGSCVALIGATTAGAAPWMEQVPDTLRWLLLALPFSAVSRVIAAYFQARRQFFRCAVATALPAVLTVAAVAIGARYAGVAGWTAGRVAGEVVPALVLLGVVRGELGRPTRAQIVDSLRFGGAMAFSLALDRVAGGIDSLVLASAATPPRVLGQYGAATLLTAVAGLPAAAALGVVLPGLVAAAQRPAHLATEVRRVLPVFAMGCLAVSAAVLAVGPHLLDAWLGLPAGTPWPFLPPLVTAAFAGALSSFGGSVLIAAGRGGLAVVQSAVAAVVGGALGALLLPHYGLPGLAAAVAIAALVRLAIMVSMATRVVQ